MALVSAGVQVSIIDESQYTAAGQNTVPYILLATAQDKLTPAGTSIAPGTLASAIGDVYLITSQRELVNTFGSPTFYKTAGGNSLHGYELNEYGLMAAYSVLGVTNRAYIQRVGVDMAELEASLTRPLGDPNNGTYWFDLVESAYGLFVWDATLNKFNLITPIVITDDADLATPGGAPLSSIGTVNSYAIVTTNASNPIYHKGTDNLWTLLGSDAWMVSMPTVTGTETNPTLSAGTFDVNGTTITLAGNEAIAAVALLIDAAGITGVTAGDVNGRLEIYTDSTAAGTAGNLTLVDGTASSLIELGLTPGDYYGPVMAHESHINIPRWREFDAEPRPTGSIWQKTTSVNDGANIVIKRYETASNTFIVQAAPMYANDETANKMLDPAAGGIGIAVGDTYVQYDVNLDNTGTFKLFERGVGETVITGSATAPTFAIGDEFTLDVSATNSTSLITYPVTLNGTDAAAFVTAVSFANIPDVSASVDVTGRITLTHAAGGVIVTEDTVNTPIADAGITDALTNVRAEGTSTTRLILSNWNLLEYTADIVTPGQNPVDGTRWYYSAVDEIDIMIHENNVWQGYRNVTTTDVRGFDLSATDPNGPIVSATPPDAQSDGLALAHGDLWVDTSNLENYATLYRWEPDANAIDGWVLIDNADQTSTDGVLFADARWDTTGTTDPIAGDMVAIPDLLISDWTDPDAPDPVLYPDGMLLWNTRRSGYNVKEFRVNYFNPTDFDLTDWQLNGGTEADAWVTVSGLKEDGSANFGRLAQRSLVIQAMKAEIATNPDIREEQRLFNLMAAPGYPELIPDMVALNNERANTSFIVGDSPLRLANNGNAITDWATNNGGLGTPTGDGLASNDEYLGVFYPSGQTTDLTGTSIIVPPSHMMLRTIIRSDEQSYPWLAPAGTRRGQVDNVDAIGYVDALTGEFQQMATRQGIRDVLYTNNVNPITFIPGAGIVNYGNKTTKPGSAQDRINVSRLISYIRVQADALSKQFVFEPNDKLTRDELKGQMDRMLNDLVAKRGLYDYLVVCDKSNNTSTRIDRNEIWVDIAIEPVKAGEFIYVPVRIQNTGSIAGG